MFKLQIKGKLLIQAQQLQSYLRNVEEAMIWITEHENFASSTEIGPNLEKAKSLQKKFENFNKVRN